MITTTPRKRGDTFTFHFDAQDATGTATPLDDCTARMQLRSQNGSRVYAEATSDPDGGIVIDVEAGTLDVTIPFSVTATLTPQTYYADLELTFDADHRVSSDTVLVPVIEDITR